MPLPEDLTCVTVADLDAATLDAVHDELLAPVFRPDELLGLDDLRASYGPGADGPSAVVLQDGRPIAVMLGEWFLGRRVLLLSYLSVSGRARGAGLGTILLGEVLPGWWGTGEAPLVLAEVDDPAVWAAEELGGDPRARLRFYGRHGADLAPLPYEQPSMRGPGGRVPGMLLLRLRAQDAGDVRLSDFLREYYVGREGPDALDDPVLQHLLDLAGRHDTAGDWWDVSRWAEVRGGTPG